MFKLRHAAAAITAAAAAIAVPAAAQAAATPVHYYADDVAGTGQFGPPVTGTAPQAIAILAARYQQDPAELVQVAAFAGFPLPGGTEFLLTHPAQRAAAASRFAAYLRATVREEVVWTSPYRTEYAVPHGTQPTAFGWTSMPAQARDVLVFTWGALVMNCGGQPYLPSRPIPLPARPQPCQPGQGFQPACSPCPQGTRLFHVPGVGWMCLCPQAVRVVVTTTTTVEVIVTTTTTTTTTVTYGVCPKPAKPAKPAKHAKKHAKHAKKKKGKKKRAASASGCGLAA